MTCRVVAALVVAALAACVRNPYPAVPLAAPDAAPDAAPAAAAVAPPRPVPSAPRPYAAGPAAGDSDPGPWPWGRAAERTVAGVEAGGGLLPRMWRGLRVAEPGRCVSFAELDYLADPLPVPRLREVAGDGFRELFGCSLFDGVSDRVVRPDRVVGAAAAHDAGLCARPGVRAAFSADPDNRLYVPVLMAQVRAEMIARGGGDWLPSRNLCWYVGTQLRVRRRYGLTVSPWEVRVFEAVLGACPVVTPVPACGPGEAGIW